MKKFDFTKKKLIDTFSYTDITDDRYSSTEVNIDGRKYLKFGTLQATTAIGLLWEDENKNRILHIGISKQHPCDSKCNKDEAYAAATERAMINPDIIINTVPKYISKYNFEKMLYWYVDGMDVEFIKTKGEMNKLGIDPKKYNR